MTNVDRARSKIMIFLLPVFCIGSIYGFMYISSLVPEFAETFDAFGSDLPLFTLGFLNYHTEIFITLSLLSITSLITAYLPMVSNKAQSAAFYYTLANPAILMLFLLLVLLAMYLPIFTSG